MSDYKEKQTKRGEDVISLLLGLAIGIGGTTGLFFLFRSLM